jgi:hypothetical protein
MEHILQDHILSKKCKTCIFHHFYTVNDLIECIKALSALFHQLGTQTGNYIDGHLSVILSAFQMFVVVCLMSHC